MGSIVWVALGWLGASLLVTLAFALGAGMGYRRRSEELRDAGAGLVGLLEPAGPPAVGAAASALGTRAAARRLGIMIGAACALALAALMVILRVDSAQQGAGRTYWLALLAVVAAAVWANRVQARRARALRSGYRMLRRMVDSASELVIVVDREGRMRFASPSAQRILGRSAQDLAGEDVAQLVHRGDRAGLDRALADGAPGGSAPAGAWLDLRMRHGDGSWRHLEVTVSDLLDDPHVRGIVLSARDATERRALEARLLHEALHDPATGLANGAALTERIRDGLSGARAGMAVMVIDLDRFRFISDAYGHAAGDRTIRLICERIQTCMRPGDMLARPDDGDFAMLCERVRDPARALAVAERLLEVIRQPQRIGDDEIVVTATIGIAVLSDGARSPEEALRDAHTAMRRAKRAGGDRCELYVAARRAEGRSRLRTESALRHALDRGELRLLYEPIVDLGTGRIEGAEALLRWQHPQRGMVPPAEFLPLAEQAGVIVPIGEWVVRSACEHLRRWTQTHPGLRAVAINLSPAQLSDPGLAAGVQAALDESGLPAWSLIVEVTESMVVRPSREAVRRLGDLKALGVRLAIDDFGTGYSSLGHMRELPIDILKIDRCFIRELEARPGTEAIIGSVVGLAHTLNLDTIAEGVETRGQAIKLAQLGCRRAQGHLYSRSRTPFELDRLLQAQAEGPPGAAFIALDAAIDASTGHGAAV